MTASIAEFPKRFDYKEAEPRIYERWLAARAFESAYAADGTLRNPAKKDAEPFVIVIPPPHITGRLHMGHALNNTVQDVFIRFHRMDGRDALWIPGTDHAGIATQTVVKKQIDAEGLDFRALGRDEVVRRIWEWKSLYGDAILHQLRKMGCSCDWTRTRFTMDDGLNRAVKEAFVQLYEKGLLYRGKRIVNWCPIDRTALSDDEVEKEEERGKMYHLRYPFKDNPREFLVVATTRPETLFGDVAVAVNPNDPRYQAAIGKVLVLPLQGREIPVIADVHADPEKGTGVVKITPAHDPNDFEVGLRHHLPQINVMNEDGSLNDVVAEKYRGFGREKARKVALEDLEALGLLDSVHEHTLAIGRSYRSRVPIEFRLSDQWFVKMQPLAEQALAVSGYARTDDGWQKTESEALRFHPDRFEKIYFHWLSNIRDWCISRQIWWGHRIPAWFHVETNEILVATDTPARVLAEPTKWRQEDDVLDTWFSSWLWPMSTLGWPEKTPDFDRYFPTHVLSTAKDILFFWVARMNFAALTFANKLPFQDVFLHSTIADEQGVTMSKSKGNGIDPLTLIEGASLEDLKRPVMDARPSNMKELLNRIEKNFPNGFEAVGADAMRWTLMMSITEGEHERLSLGRFTEGRNFITKLWNGAGRILSQLQHEQQEADASPWTRTAMSDEDRWLLTRLDVVIGEVRKGIANYDFGSVAQTLYHFVWDDFCAWALELSKTRLSSPDRNVRRSALSVMGSVLADMLRLLHPMIPFVTEELWSQLVPSMNALDLWLDKKPDNAILALDAMPKVRAPVDIETVQRFQILQRFVIAVRQLRAASNIKDSVRVTVSVKPLATETQAMLLRAKQAASFLAKLDDIAFVTERRPGMVAEYDAAFEIYLDLGQYVDKAAELERMDKELAKSAKELEAQQQMLANPNFVDRAPPEKVQEAQSRIQVLIARMDKLRQTRTELSQ